MQYRLILLAPDLPDLALALNLAALNVGIAAGAAVGGLAVDRGGLTWLGLLGAAIVSGGVLATLAGARATPASLSPPPAPGPGTRLPPPDVAP